MCGLAGIIDFGRQVDPAHAVAMARVLGHRGPDDEGSYSEPGVALAHRRLAIIDLSRDGRQPMSDETGRYKLVFNGEIYNYLELRAVLEKLGRTFQTRTDTEVVLTAFSEWGGECVQRFNGMWAFAVWDSKTRSLFCSRDRFGEKPFYYRSQGGRFVFASELKAFRALPGLSLSPNLTMVRDYLEQTFLDHTGETFFTGIHQLPAAHSLVVSQDGMRLERYWRLQPSDVPAGDPAESLRELFLDSVRLRLRSDVPIGTCLSGGLDSSAIACGVDHLLRTETDHARQIGDRQNTFTAYFEQAGLDERPYASAVVDQIGAVGHWVSFSSEDLLENLHAIVESQDEPFRSTSMIAQWYVMRAAREAGMKVMLDGQGGDELFAGYDGYFGYFFANLLRRARLRELAGELAAHRNVRRASSAATAGALVRPFVPARLSRRVRARLTGGASLAHPELRRTAKTPSPSGNTFSDPLRRQLQLVVLTRLPELLHYEDRNSMAHSLEARVPFLDHRLAEFAFSLEAHHLIHRGVTKIVVRRGLGDLLPAIVRERVDKLGFGTPETEWLRDGLGELAADVFHSRSFAERGFIDARAAQRRLELHRREQVSAGSELWRALNLELWARALVDA
jgi:asparagine synthase (glutamine-hydrolysing)